MTMMAFHVVHTSEPINILYVDVRVADPFSRDYGCLTFLYADPTPSALQVFLRCSGISGVSASGLPAEQGDQEGIWLNADPIPGCVVCNIGESECLRY
jgi:hypothetical protein